MIDLNSFFIGHILGIFFATLFLYIIYNHILENLKKNMSNE